MGFNYGLEKRRFDQEWERLEKEYREAGMLEDAIREMRAYDWEVFKGRRVYETHNQGMPMFSSESGDMEGYDKSPLTQRFLENVSVTLKLESTDLECWLDELDSKELYQSIKKMDQFSVEILTMWAMHDMTVREIAQKTGYSKSAISRQICKIRDLLGKCRK